MSDAESSVLSQSPEMASRPDPKSTPKSKATARLSLLLQGKQPKDMQEEPPTRRRLKKRKVVHSPERDDNRPHEDEEDADESHEEEVEEEQPVMRRPAAVESPGRHTSAPLRQDDDGHVDGEHGGQAGEGSAADIADVAAAAGAHALVALGAGGKKGKGKGKGKRTGASGPDDSSESDSECSSDVDIENNKRGKQIDKMKQRLQNEKEKTKAIAQKCREQIKDVQEQAKDKFRKWRSKHKGAELTLQWQEAKAKGASDEHLGQLIETYMARHARTDDHEVSLVRSNDMNQSLSEVELSYVRACNVYRLDPWGGGKTRRGSCWRMSRLASCRSGGPQKMRSPIWRPKA